MKNIYIAYPNVKIFRLPVSFDFDITYNALIKVNENNEINNVFCWLSIQDVAGILSSC